MRGSLVLAAVALLLAAAPAQAVLIGFFPGLEALAEKADAIVILRIDRTIGDFGHPTLYSTHECYIYQALKGEIPAGARIRLQLMDTRTEFVTPFANSSTHLMFLTKKKTDDEPTEYRTLAIRGANVRVSPFGQEKMPPGNTLTEQLTALLKDAATYHRKQSDKEQAFLDKLIASKPEPTDAAD